MTPSKLPVRPSLGSLRKQAKKLARANAVSQRDAQLVLAREYGFAEWKDLVKEVEQRLGRGLEWAVSEARRIIHDNDVEGLRQLLPEYPELLSWRANENDGGLLGMATGSFGDAGDVFREEYFTRMQCAELLLDAGAIVAPTVCESLIRSRARGLINLFQRRGLLPRTLKFLAALGDFEGVRNALDTNGDNLAAVNEAFMYACHLQHTNVAALLLDRAITLDAELGGHIEDGPGRPAFIEYFIAHKPDVHEREPFWPWQAFVEQHIMQAMQDGDMATFAVIWEREPWLLAEPSVKFQIRLIEGTAAALNDRSPFLKAFLDLDPAVLHCPVRPPSRVFVHAFTYAQSQVLPLLMPIWPMPDDLPHAAGNGDFARVKLWFDAAASLRSVNSRVTSLPTTPGSAGTCNGERPLCSRFSTPHSPGR
jgi:hypothetical protein